MGLDSYTNSLLRIGQSDPAFSFLFDKLLKSRIATDNESNKEFFDEDVNIYLSLLLNSMVSDEFHKVSARYVAGYETDLPEILDSVDTSYMKYQIYRINADFLLLQTGLFLVPGEVNQNERSFKESVERGKTYYRFACSFTDKIPERYRPISQILGKLSYGFETYREILSFMRGEYLNIISPLSDGDMGVIYRDMDDQERTAAIEVAQNDLLDAYLNFQSDESEVNREEFRMAFRKLKELDPESRPDFDIEN